MEKEIPRPLAVLLIGAIVAVIGFVGLMFVSPGTQPVSHAVTPVATVAETPPTPAPHQPAILLHVSGNGLKSTPTFVAPDEWTLAYNYDCSSFGMRGNFIIMIYGADGGLPTIAANELAMSGSDAQYLHQGGKIYLEVNSGCSWNITAKG